MPAARIYSPAIILHDEKGDVKMALIPEDELIRIKIDNFELMKALFDLRNAVVAALILLPIGNGGKQLLEDELRKANQILNKLQ